MIASHETLTEQEIAQVRKKAQEILELARADSPFLQKVADDPAGALRAFGFPENGIPTSWIKPDITHFATGRECVDTTCWSSACPDTCYVSIGWAGRQVRLP